MIVSGRAVVLVAVPELWAALSDPARLGQALPHVDTVDVRDDGSFSAIARPRTGLGDTPLRMIADQREGEHVRIVGSGLPARTRCR
jgi:carbon monoxide dehydrogenase subunit G